MATINVADASSHPAKDQPLFLTDRLIGRRITAKDVGSLLAVYGDPQTVRYVGDGDPLCQADAIRWVEVTDQNFEARGYGMIALDDLETGETIGFAGIVHPGQQPEAEVKYAFRSDHWGKGLATEAIVALIAFGREHWGVGEVIAAVHPDNKPSMNVLNKAGFVHVEDRVNDDETVTSLWKSAESQPT